VKADSTDTKVSMTSLKSAKLEYKKLCFSFFLKQLEFLKPQLILCLGNEVKKTLQEKWINKTLLAPYKFAFIPHPSFAHANWNESVRAEIKLILDEHQPKILGFGSGKGMLTLLPGWDDPLHEEFKDYM
jgi:hypothetical protein